MKIGTPSTETLDRKTRSVTRLKAQGIPKTDQALVSKLVDDLGISNLTLKQKTFIDKASATEDDDVCNCSGLRGSPRPAL